MLVNIWAYGTAFSVTLTPSFAFSKPAIAVLKPASSLSVPQVVNDRVPLPAFGFELDGVKPHAESNAGTATAPDAARNRRLLRSIGAASSFRLWHRKQQPIEVVRFAPLERDDRFPLARNP